MKCEVWIAQRVDSVDSGECGTWSVDWGVEGVKCRVLTFKIQASFAWQAWQQMPNRSWLVGWRGTATFYVSVERIYSAEYGGNQGVQCVVGNVVAEQRVDCKIYTVKCKVWSAGCGVGSVKR